MTQKKRTTKERKVEPQDGSSNGGSAQATNGRKRQRLRQISVRVDDATWKMIHDVNSALGEREKKNLSFNFTFQYAMGELYEKLYGKPYRT